MPKQNTSLFARCAVVASVLLFVATLASAAERVTYHHFDALGSPVAATDEQGNVLWRETYQPYGERIRNEAAAANNTRWYTGHPQDPETGLVYAGARYYDPVIGRFMAMDPQPFMEGNIQSFNRYAYGNNNPYKYVDPDGNAPVDTLVDAGFVIYDTGRFLGATAAYVVGLVTGDPALAAEGRAGLAETSWSLGGSVTGFAIPYAPAAVTRGVGKGTGEIVNSTQSGKITTEVLERAKPGRDGATSRHIIERMDGEAISKTHQVTKDGKIIHQHQDHIGKHGGMRHFPDEWTGTPTINADVPHHLLK